MIKYIKKIIHRTGESSFLDSKSYWINRYKNGGNSGAGSYNDLALFKAEVINKFISENKIREVIEFGCGDGNQLKYLKIPKYIGFDISPDAIKMCQTEFNGEKTKTFQVLENYQGEKGELILSLDVIFHLTEDLIFHEYMKRLFETSEKYVIIYSSNFEGDYKNNHVKHRKFTNWIDENINTFKLIQKIPNKFPFKGNVETGSFADFYFFEKIN